MRNVGFAAVIHYNVNLKFTRPVRRKELDRKYSDNYNVQHILCVSSKTLQNLNEL